jgi:hypothetical protein
MRNLLLHWWAAFDQISIAPTVCPPSPEGQTQAAQAVIAQAEWVNAFDFAALITVLLVAVLVLITYETRRMGNKFWHRWWLFLSATAVLAGVTAFLLLANTPVRTDACEYGNVTTRIPTTYVMTRSTVALAQGALLFVVLSWILSLIARLTHRAKWYNNWRIPFGF